jgi:hypothetical protein
MIRHTSSLSRHLLVLLAATATGLIGLNHAAAQETSEEVKKKVVIHKHQEDAGKKVKVEKQERRIVIVTDDGEKHVIQLDEHKGDPRVVVEVETDDHSGETRSLHRAILVGPSGKQEVILQGESGDLVKVAPQLMWRAEAGEGEERAMIITTLKNGQFVIGINGEVADDTLKMHLGLDHGLVVQDVYEESAASQAGLHQHDILTRANDRPLEKLEDLVEEIQKSGKAEASVTLQLMRQGKEIAVEVKPQKQPGPLMDLTVDLEHAENVLSDRQHLQLALPGLIQARSKPDADKSLDEQIAELRELVNQLREEVRDK